MEQQAATVLALWLDRLIKPSDVVDWADRQILRADAVAIPPWLIELSLRGPVACAKDPSVRLPAPVELTFSDRFAIRVLLLDLTNTKDVEAFVAWAANAAMGEDLELPEVRLSYVLDHYINDCDDVDLAVTEARKQLPELRKALRARAETLLTCAA